MRKTLTDKGVAALKPRPQRYAYPDPELRGHYVRIQPSGAKASSPSPASPDGKQVWTHDRRGRRACGIEEAREQARDGDRARPRRAAGVREPRAKPSPTSPSNWLKRHVERERPALRRRSSGCCERHVLPAWNEREFLASAAAMLPPCSTRSRTTTARGRPTTAEHRAQHHELVRRPARRLQPADRARHAAAESEAQARGRIFDDDEIRAIWKAAEASGTFGGIVRLALLTAQRRTKFVDHEMGRHLG